MPQHSLTSSNSGGQCTQTENGGNGRCQQAKRESDCQMAFNDSSKRFTSLLLVRPNKFTSTDDGDRCQNKNQAEKCISSAAASAFDLPC
ncbi:hypothetical protein TYRP_009391 [Tyrophagus putrescentiae]|nr:hypothetical protein TYRP_009391 [Tyrophagus putrescentiae]